MGDILLVRLDKKLHHLINKYIEEYQIEKSESIRRLIFDGIFMNAIKEYLAGRLSIGKAASMVDMSISDLLDKLVLLGIPSTLELDDIMDGYQNLIELK